MAIIYSYPQVKPKASDLLIGTVTYDATGENPVDGNPTRTFSVQDVANLVASYELTTKQSGTNAVLQLKNDTGGLSAVNLVAGNGISLLSNGSNAITISNSGISNVNAVDTNYIDLTSSIVSGVLTISSSLSATGTPTSSSYLRGDNKWSVPVNSITAASSTFINVGPSTTSTGPVIITAALSATGTPSNETFLRGDNTWAIPAGGGGGGMSNWNLELTSPNSLPVYSTITNDENVRISSGSSEIVMSMLVNDPVYDGTWAQWDLDLSRTGASLGVQSASDFIMFARPELSGNPELLNGQYKVLPSNISLSAFGVPTADLNIGTNKLINVVDPVNPQDAATKFYVDNAIAEGQGIMAKDSFLSDGIQTQYTLSVTPTSATYTEVFISGVYQEASTYNLLGDVITLSAAPDNGDTIEIVTFNLGAGGSGGGAVDSIIAGTGILVSSQTGNVTVTNTQPDQIVSLTGSGGTTVTGTYPNFNISSSTSGTGVDSVVSGNGISIDNTDPTNPIVNNTAPDQIVALNSGTDISITGAYPNFTISSTASGGGGITSVQPGTNITIDNTDPANPIINASAGSGSAAQLADLSDVQTFGFQSYALLPGAGTNATSNQATILGYNAAPNTTGGQTTAFGNGALFSVTTGASNTAIGHTAQYTVTTAGFNTSVGEGTIINHSGESNVAMGYRAMWKSTAPQLASSNNVILGSNAITTASSALTGNVVIGAYANSITGGSDNIRIGNERFTTPVYSIGTGSHKISLGSNQVDGAYVNVAWTVVSDERDKMDFNPVPAGLDFVNKLKPVSYYRRKERGKDERAGFKKYGFKAQDILALEGNDPVIIDASNEDQLMYTESNLIPVLVKAIQELKAEIEILKNN
jgi:hypothetical protein